MRTSLPRRMLPTCKFLLLTEHPVLWLSMEHHFHLPAFVVLSLQCGGKAFTLPACAAIFPPQDCALQLGLAGGAYGIVYCESRFCWYLSPIT